MNDGMVAPSAADMYSSIGNFFSWNLFTVRAITRRLKTSVSIVQKAGS